MILNQLMSYFAKKVKEWSRVPRFLNPVRDLRNRAPGGISFKAFEIVSRLMDIRSERSYEMRTGVRNKETSKMRTIASNEHYVIQVDESRNRLYFVMKGSWIDTKAVPNWQEDVKTALTFLSPGFTELIDWTDVGSILLTDYIATAQELAMKAGVRKAARVYSAERFLKVQMDSLSQKTGFPVKSFLDKEEAEAWLDE